MQVHIVIRFSMTLVLMAACLSLFAYELVLNAGEESAMSSGLHAQQWGTREIPASLPAYPQQKNLMPVDIDAPHAGFKYFIDPESIQIGSDGLTSRLTMVIESRTGYQNILVERYRCNSREYKTLAYGTGKETFYERHAPVWENIEQRSGSGSDYRRDLITAYLCDGNGTALRKRDILRRVRFPQDMPENSGGF